MACLNICLRKKSLTTLGEDQEQRIQCSGKKIIPVALAIIFLIASLSAAGLLFPRIGYSSLAIAAGGILLSSIPLFFLRAPGKTKIDSLPHLSLKRKEDAKSEGDLPPLLSQQTQRESLLKSLPGFTPDDRLLAIPLSFWLNPIPKDDFESRDLEAIQDPKQSKAVRLLSERTVELDEEFNLVERIERLNGPSIYLKSLLPGWNDSPLRFHLMLDDELYALQVKDVKSNADQQALVDLYYRISWLSTERNSWIGNGQIDEETHITDLVDFSAEAINENAAMVPLVTFLLIKDEEFQALNMEALLTKQIELIFSRKAALLSKEQLDAGILLLENFEVLDSFGEREVLLLNTNLITQPIFDILFKIDFMPSIGLLCLQKLGENVYPLLRFFTQDHWPHLHITDSFDFTQIPEEKREEAINAIFDFSLDVFSKGFELYKTLDVDQREFVRRYLKPESLDFIANNTY